MARVTVEDCVDKVPNRFELVLLAGHRARTWDGRDAGGRPAASDVYLYRLQAGDLVRCRRMTLVR